MQGYKVVWVPGCDHAGIATQVCLPDLAILIIFHICFSFKLNVKPVSNLLVLLSDGGGEKVV